MYPYLIAPTPHLPKRAVDGMRNDIMALDNYGAT